MANTKVFRSKLRLRSGNDFRGPEKPEMTGFLKG